MNKTVIIGAGLTGLSAALDIQGNKPVEVFEKEDSPGGLCRTESYKGFRFDYAGHFLHFKDSGIKNEVSNLLSGNIKKVERKSFIVYKDRRIPYPFQSHIKYLPLEERRECLLEFLMSGYKQAPEDGNFRSWMNKRFGSGITKYFMLPYNRKLWTVDPGEMTTEWMSRYLPRPSAEKILKGAFFEKSPAEGYNAVFYYPPDGIGALPSQMSSRLKKGVLHTGVSVEKVIPGKKLIIAGGKKYSYENLITTVPLKKFAAEIVDGPDDLKKHARQLRGVSVLNINIGWKGGPGKGVPRGAHWLYFPESRYVFYRAGFPSQISSLMAPEGCFSCYTEIAFPQKRFPKREDFPEIEKRVEKQLREARVIPPGSKVRAVLSLPMEPAYVIYDKRRSKGVSEVLRKLESVGIYSAGRYGAWEYSAMEDAILSGKKAAEKCLKKN